MEFVAKSFENIISMLGKPTNKFYFIFRGQSDASWKLIPKIARDPYVKFFDDKRKEIDWLESWKRYSVQYIDKKPEDDWDWLTLAQHYGMATRLLDWSKNPLVALFFAVYQNGGTDAAFYALNQPKNEEKYGISPFDVNTLLRYYPKGISARVINQRGIFTISPDPKISIDDLVDPKELYKVIIPQKIIGDVLNNLDFWGVNELSIYPDLSGLSNHLNRLAIELIK